MPPAVPCHSHFAEAPSAFCCTSARHGGNWACPTSLQEEGRRAYAQTAARAFNARARHRTDRLGTTTLLLSGAVSHSPGHAPWRALSQLCAAPLPLQRSVFCARQDLRQVRRRTAWNLPAFWHCKRRFTHASSDGSVGLTTASRTWDWAMGGSLGRWQAHCSIQHHGSRTLLPQPL